MGRRIKKPNPKKDAVMNLKTRADKITTNINIKIDFTLPELSATKIVTWTCHVDDSHKGRNYMILGRYLLTESGLNLKFSDQVIEADNVPFKGSVAPVVDMGTYEF